MSKTILIVDDEDAILEIIETNLAREGFRVLTADCGAQALKQAQQNPDLIVLDVGLPDLDGFEVCSRLRESTSVPIIMVTARGQDEDKIHGLETGADDYLVKPFNPKELVARIKALFRRLEGAGRGASSNRLGFKELEIDLLRRRVSLGTDSLDLTPKEYDLLTFLVSRPEEVLTREQILVEVWGSEHLDARSVDVHIRYLREKLGKPASAYIKTVWGKGYRFGDG